jgi:16S rRNA processing protein RimM
MRSSDRKIILGKLGKPHGLKGFLYIRYYGDDPKSLLTFSQIYSEDSSLGKVDKIAELKDRVTIHISGINTRNSAETLRDKEIYIQEDQLPKLDNGEAYFYQLENLMVRNKQDDILGLVDYIMPTGANDVLVVKPSKESIDDKERLIPYLRPKIIESIEIEEGQIIVVWPKDY